MKFKEFREVDICNQRSSIGYCFFFLSKKSAVCPSSQKKGILIIRGIHITAITHIGLAVPDLDSAIKWYEQVLGFRLLAGPYSFDTSMENKLNMTNDPLGNTVKKMLNAHLMADNGVEIELFEFLE
ncbi:VOC family protein [Peribacillus frigoritolerans]|uniref:VOC family protein n=1 Tax=Peribacillus frigoritolerans TaxID=450367 RepID=UPI00330663B1